MGTSDLTLLLDHLQYWPDVRQFSWKRSPGVRAPVNAPAGHRTASGHLVIRFRGRAYPVERLIEALTAQGHCRPTDLPRAPSNSLAAKCAGTSSPNSIS